MDNTRLTRVLLILLIILAVLFLAQMLWQLISGFADQLLLFLLGWLVAFVLNPVVLLMSEHTIPHGLAHALEPAFGTERARHLGNWRVSRGLAVAIVYLALFLALLLLVAIFVPTAIIQLSALAKQMPEHMAQVSVAGVWTQDQLARLGVHLNVQDALSAGLAGLQSYAAELIQNALVIFTSLLGLFANLFFVLVIGFIITLDGPRLLLGIMQLIPGSIKNHIQFLGQSIDRTFGGFIRGQLIQALLQSIGTAIVMSLFGLDYVLIASSFAGLFMLIPLVGPFLALLPPLLAVVLQSPGVAIWVLVILFIFQLAITNILMPRLMSEAVGLHPLWVFAAILFGIKIAGFWGAFFGIPVAGVLWAMAKFLFVDWRGISGPASPELTEGDLE